jgi:translation initiation factor IF-2
MADKRKLNKNEIKKQLVDVNSKIENGVFIFTGPMVIVDFANAIKKPVNEIISYFFKQGKMYNINKTLDEEEIATLCLDYGYDFQKEKEINAQNFMDNVEIFDEEKELSERPPIITVMGHVDHGKTTLIDKIRGSQIAENEAGGITQHIGAYQVEYKKKKITFLDTPGHESFALMRSRGAKLTDIIVLVIAADDGVMAQTKEAIAHAKFSNVPIIVFVNKMDKQNADLEKIKAELSNENIIPEDWGGDIQFVIGSALQNKGINDLFEAILIQSEMLELKANSNRLPIGTIVESHIDKGRGTIATLIVENGTLMQRDFIVAGSKYGRVRTLEDFFGKKINFALPGTPVVVTGLNYVPQAGDKFFAFKDEKFAKNLAQKKEFADKQKNLRERNVVEIKDGKKIINLIIKSDVQGTAEAVKHSLSKLQNEEAKINIVSANVGLVSKSDLLLAIASNASIYCFNTLLNSNLNKMVEENKIEVKFYKIIYKMIADVEKMLKGKLAPKYKDELTGRALVLKVFFYSKVGNIAGCKMETGFIKANAKVKIYRENKLIHEGKIDSLQKEKNLVKKVEVGKEFGTHIYKFNDIKVDDIIEAYQEVEIKK